MYYHTPDVSTYVSRIRKFRLFILIFFIAVSSLASFFLRPELISSDTLYWLDESKELQKTRSNDFATSYVGCLSIDISHFDGEAKSVLQSLQAQLEKNKDINQVESLFSSYRIYNDGGEESTLVRALPINELNASDMVAFVSSYPEPYKRFVNRDFSHFNFIIHSQKPFDLSAYKISYPHHFSEPSEEAQLSHYLIYIGIFIITLLVMSRWLFKNYIAAFGAICVTLITAILTFTTMVVITGHRQIHIAMTLMVVSVSIGHYLYFYYRWHVSQFKSDSVRAMEKSINRNLQPALWTLPVLILGLGSLLFADSPIITMLSLSLMISSAFAYIINVTFLPAMLSYFTVNHPRVGFARVCYVFANREIHYNHRLLQIFMLITFIIALMGTYRFTTGSDTMFDAQVIEKTITLKVPYKEIDLNLLKKLKQFEKDIKKENQGIKKVDSIETILESLDLANVPNAPLDEQRLLQAIFFLELYDMEKGYIDGDAINVTITLDHADHSSVIRWIKNYQQLPIFFTDLETLSESAKMDKRLLLASSLLSALIMIGFIMGMMFRSFKIGMIGFIANSIPVMWFGLFLVVFDFELSIEAMIAMAISVGLTSDTIIHFAYKYFRSRYFGRTKKHALEIMFFYAGVPAIVGAVVLMSVFALLTLTQLDTLVLIGGYGALLMFISLITDLFILPVLLLAIDEQKEYHATMRGTESKN